MASKKLNIKGTRGQDLTAARAELRAFRHDVAILKRKGLLDKKYDARSVKPTKYLKTQIKNFESVLSGTATPVKVTKANLKYYKEQGYKTKGKRVIVSHLPNEKVYGTRGDFRTSVKGRGGKITKTNLKLDKHSINQWIDDLRNNRFRLKENELLSFQLYGNNSYQSFGNRVGKTAQEQMADKLEAYSSISALMIHGKPDQEEELIENIVIFKVERDLETQLPVARPEPSPGARKDAEEYKRRRRERLRRERAARVENMTQSQRDRYLDDRADREKARRDKMTPAQREQYKEAARKRMSNLRVGAKDDGKKKT